MELLIEFEVVVQSLLNVWSLWHLLFDPNPNHTPIKYRCPIKKSDQVTPAYVSILSV